ncbi:cAMP and cAMP-inhibited cGMP 3',5'-cyclic phosphodiesterase 10A-like [Macrosteles quadrilineatus]|uniref:cAMP and cAMP-inhibited cGMP 3',5'-cyclic phosphodiesterase 10A-like n=1 Tax=Macrosteles quadrilineatus TaxID=74068 RepID=UPI0023E2920C|nr:cAMP and cAMP-inhibited cGMP 3',5'-cyclic phosphodiesterase 10A-like [Macrosteles quadrilineatus]
MEMNTNLEEWNFQMEELLEPNYFPDPVIFRDSSENLKIYKEELKGNLKTNKTTFNVLAPYLETVYKDQKKALSESAKNLTFSAKSKEAKLLLCDKKTKDQYKSNRHAQILEQYEMIVSIHETADVLKNLLRANTVVSYLVNTDRNELYQSPRYVISSMDTLTWRIDSGSTMAAYAAFTKQYIISNNVLSDARFPLGLGFPGSLMKYGLCVPIKTTDEKVVAVYELARDAFAAEFEPTDIQMVLTITGWMGFAIQYHSLCTDLMHRLQLGDYLLQLTDHYHGGHATLYETLSAIVTFAKHTVSAEICNFYLVEKGSQETMTIEEYNQDSENSLLKRKRKKNVVQDDGSYLSQVVFGKVVVNKYETQVEIVSHSDRIKIRSILCVPIICKCGEVIGIIQLTNKKTAFKFDKYDEDIVQMFCVFFAINLNTNMLQECEKRYMFQNSVNREMLLYHMSPCNHDHSLIKKPLENLPNDIHLITWFPPQDSKGILPHLTLHMFHEVLGESFMLLNDVQEFILTVRGCYRLNPYHNFAHAVNATHKMSHLLKHYSGMFSGLERLSLMIAILCHDVDHQGYSNSFVKLTDHNFSKLYETSPIENHIFAATKIILEKHEMLKYLNSSIYNKLLLEVYECIKATDLSSYFQSRVKLLGLAEENILNLKQNDHRRYIKNIMMISCDLSDQIMPFPDCRKLTEEYYEEMFCQGDLLKRKNLTPMPFMDRSQKDMIPENQIQFLLVVLLPMLKKMSQIFEIFTPLVSNGKEVVKHWQTLIEIKHQDTWRPEESVPKAPTSLM